MYNISMSSLRVLCLQKWLKIGREPSEDIPNNISCSPDFLKKEVMLTTKDTKKFSANAIFQTYITLEHQAHTNGILATFEYGFQTLISVFRAPSC